jgi:hypothetical protein
MSRTQPAHDCYDLTFGVTYAMGEAAEVALEDYCREMTRAGAAEAVRTPDGRVRSLHLCRLPEPVTAKASRDVEDFARSLVTPESGGLGWS